MIILIFVNGRAFSVLRMKGRFTNAFIKLLSSVAKYAPGSYYFLLSSLPEIKKT